MADYAPGTAPKPPVESRSKEYRCYVRMIHRCHNPDYGGYERYGARGIAVCARWRESFANFLSDMGRAPTPEHSIEREKNDQGYSPDNCKWATREVQDNNRRTSVHLEFDGRRQTIAQWAREMGVSRKKLWKRKKLGWADNEVLRELPPVPRGGRLLGNPDTPPA
jgi:hypothetical protein